jgi:hypothetical protein
MELRLTFFMALALSAVALTGCGDDSGGTVCEAGRQLDCACGGGATGFQRCRDDGSGYDACECMATDAGGDAMVDTSVADTSVDTGADTSAMCDDGTMHDRSTPECTDCFNCAFASGFCATEAAACDADSDCEDFGVCGSACFDEKDVDACIAMCDAAHPTGSSLYRAVQTCGFCTVCPNNCDATAPPCT